MIDVAGMSRQELEALSDEELAQLDPGEVQAVALRLGELDQAESDSDVIYVAGAVKNLLLHWSSTLSHYRENYAVVYGDQFTEEEKAVLRSAKPARPETTHNKILPKVMQFAGSMITHVRSMTVFPKDGSGSDEVARRMNKIVKFIERFNELDYVRFQTALSGFITRIGWYYMPPPPPDARGDDLIPKIVFEDAELVLIDPDARDIRDQKTWKFVDHVSWLSLEDLIGLAPDKEADIRARIKPDGTCDTAFDRLSIGIETTSTTSSTGRGTNSINDLFDSVGRLYRVDEFWERKYKTIPDDDFPGYTKRESYMLLRVTCQYLNMRLGRYELPYNYYPFFPNIPIDLGGSIIDRQSAVDQMIPLQRERNRLFALWEKISRRQLSKTVILAAGETELEKSMIDRGDEAGIYTSSTASGGGNPIQMVLDPAVQIGEIERLLALNAQDFEDVSFVIPAVAGVNEDPNQQDTFYDQRLQQGNQALSPFFYTEWKTTMPMLYRAMIERIQLYMTYETTLRISGDVAGQYEDVTINQYDLITNKILNDVTVGKYDIEIDDSAFTNNVHEAQVGVLGKLMQQLPPAGTPPQVFGLVLSMLVENSPQIDRRKETAALIKQYYGLVGQPGLDQGQGAPPGMPGLPPGLPPGVPSQIPAQLIPGQQVQ